MSENYNVPATTNGYVAAPEPKFVTTVPAWSRKKSSDAKKATISIRNFLGTSNEKPVGSRYVPNGAGNAPTYFAQSAAGALVVDVNRAKSRNSGVRGYQTTWATSTRPSALDNTVGEYAKAAIQPNRNGGEYMTIQNATAAKADSSYRRLMSAAETKVTSGQTSNRVRLNKDQQLKLYRTASHATLDNVKVEDTPYKGDDAMDRADSNSLERNTASRSSLRNKTFYMTGAGSRAELRKIDEDDRVVIPATRNLKRMKSAAVKPKLQLKRGNSVGNLTQEGWMTNTPRSRNFKGPYKQFTLREVASEYPGKMTNMDFHIQGYQVEKTQGKPCLSYVKYYEENEKYSKNFMNQVLRRAKEQPDQFKTDVHAHKKWTDMGIKSGQFSETCMNKRGTSRKTRLQEIFEQAKDKPGPNKYKVEACHKYMYKIKGSYLTAIKDGNENFTITESEAFVKKQIPGPQHKYQLNHDKIMERTPFLTNFAKSTGRIADKDRGKVPKKEKVGPGLYFPEKAVDKNVLRKSTSVVFSGLGTAESQKENIKHADKLKVKTSRFYDQIVKRAKFGPGVGHYKNLEKAMDRKASLPRSMASKRH